MKEFTITQVSEMLGIHDQTIRKWEKDFNLKVPRNDVGNRYYTSEHIEILKAIKTKKDEGATKETIIKDLISNEDIIEKQTQSMELVRIDQLTGKELIHIIAEEMLRREKELIEEFEEKLSEETERLEMRMQEELSKQAEKIHEQIRSENTRLMDYLEKRREEEQKKGFWRKFFK